MYLYMLNKNHSIYVAINSYYFKALDKVFVAQNIKIPIKSKFDERFANLSNYYEDDRRYMLSNKPK